MSASEPTRVGVLTVSDRASRGEYEDRGGPAVADFLQRRFAPGFARHDRLVPDDPDAISAALVELCDTVGCSLVITTGGTGPSPRDLTPEATRVVLERELPGFGERRRSISVDRVPTAILSRQIAGIRGRSLIVNLPGSPKAIEDCLEAVIPAIPHCLELLGAPPLPLSDGSTPLRHE
jgi:molybdopterin adenylyltransferase